MSKTVVVFTCAHTDPSISNERFTWLGKFLFDLKPDYVVDLGDFNDMKSLNSYDTGNPTGLVSQSYEKDIDHGNDAQERIRHYFKLNKKKRPVFYGFEGNHECFQGHTEIFTEEHGWLRASEVSESDTVMTMRGWEKVEKTHKYFYTGPMVVFGERNFTVTPSHRVYYYTTSSNLLVKEAKDTPVEFDVPVSTSNHSSGLTLSDDEIRLSAMCLTDSYHGKEGKVVLYQSGDKAALFRDTLNSLKIPFREKIRDRDITHICGKELKSVQVSYEFHFDRSDWMPSQNKRIPIEFFELSERQSKLFIDTLIYCDGSTFLDGRASRVFYGKKEICDDVQALCNFHGNRASVSEYRPNQWRVNINPRSKLRVKKKPPVSISDWVYCITVPSGNFLARQNGLSMFTGNCRIKKAVKKDPRLKGDKFGISTSHLETDRWYDEYHEYSNDAPAIAEYDGVLYAHYFSSGNFGSAVSGQHHAYTLLQNLNNSATCGHSHKRNMYFKDGSYPNSIIGLVAGCFKGGDDTWAGQAQHSWWKGVVIKHNLEDGCYEPQFVSLKQLKKEYS